MKEWTGGVRDERKERGVRLKSLHSSKYGGMVKYTTIVTDLLDREKNYINEPRIESS